MNKLLALILIAACLSLAGCGGFRGFESVEQGVQTIAYLLNIHLIFTIFSCISLFFISNQKS